MGKRIQLVNSNKGFSLVELMVVVAIIGILAVIGIPQYQKFKSKARQAEAKSILNAVFVAESQFFTEYATYTGNIASIGVGATGTNLRYNAGFTGNTCVGEATQTPATAAGNNDVISASPAGATWHWIVLGDTIADTANAAIVCTGAAYEAGAWGNPSHDNDAGANNKDLFSISNIKVLTHRSAWL